MANGNLPTCLAVTLEFEGGYVNHPKDPGGATNRGVTQAVYDQWRKMRGQPKQPVKLIAGAEVEAIYETLYWKKVRGEELPKGCDLATMDLGVNSGVGRAAKFAQQVSGAPVDGKFGPLTVAYIREMAPRTFIKRLCAKRLGFVQSLKIWSTFGKGWSRRIAAIEATALSWVSTKPQLESDAKQAKDAANKQAGGAVVTTGGGTIVEQTPDAAFNFPWWALALVILLVATPLVIRAVINFQRAIALANAAKEA